MQQISPAISPEPPSSEPPSSEPLSSEPQDPLAIYEQLVAKHSAQIQPTRELICEFLVRASNQLDLPVDIGVDLDIPLTIKTLATNIADSLPLTIDTDTFYAYVADYLVAKSSYHYWYDMVASRIAMDRIHQITSDSLQKTAWLAQHNVDLHGRVSPILSTQTYHIIATHYQELERAIDYSRDYLFDYFGIKTLERSYLHKLHGTRFKIIERPQHMWMRVAIGIHGAEIEQAIETYHLLSTKQMTHATPTLFNAGTPKPQMSSCFLQAIDDNIESIFNSVSEMAHVSKWAGGIGVHISALRGRGSVIRGTNGIASGIVPLCIMVNKLAKYINQGGKRNGSIACYLEPWHPDIFDFCDLRKNTGSDDNRARDLFLGLWVPSLFMERVRTDQMWSLMCPDQSRGLNTTHSDEFDALYTQYESEHRYTRQVRARDLWRHILEAQSETGFPYILYKDNANKKSNQQNLGTIRSSNLCAEIIQYSDEHETAVCNLASICLPMFVDRTSVPRYDYERLERCCRVACRNLDKIIDANYYPTEKTRRSNARHRPMGIGVQGLADVYNLMCVGFDTPEAYDLNLRIFETIYYAVIDESKNLAIRYGAYETFQGSPASKGRLQFHMWGIGSNQMLQGYDWDRLTREVQRYGLRNSLLTALMPTASTSQIMGNSECIEPYMSNIFKRSTLAGEFIVVNKNLMRCLLDLGLWDDDMRKRLIVANGSVQNIAQIPEAIKKIYKTAFEIKQMHLVKQSADRGRFVDQAQSFNLFMGEPDFDVLTSALFASHDLGNKTGMYYYRSLPAINPINFGIDIDDLQRLGREDLVRADQKNACPYVPGSAPADCMACGS